MERWDRELPGVIEATTKRAIQELEDARKTGRPLRTPAGQNHFSKVFEVSVERSSDPGGEAFVRTGVTLGRRFWLASIRHLLTGAAEVLTEHKWTVAEPADRGEWPLTDHPALKLNYYGPGKYDFGGGWGVRRTDLMMPLTPRHLLMTEVGKDAGRKVVLTQEQTDRVRRFLVERAHRWVFTSRQLDWVVGVRPRLVDAEQFEREAEMWARWDEDQTEAEMS